METKVLRGIRELVHGLGELLGQGLVCLPLILFLASVTLVLESMGVFRAADDAVIGTVASMRGPADLDELPSLHDRVASLLIGKDIFLSDFGRTLPFDKSLLGPHLRKLIAAKPSVVAVDLDAIPRGVDPASDAKAVDQPMFKAIRPVLEANIPVVLVSFPSRNIAEEARAHAWRQKFCEAAAELRSGIGDKPVGKLWWASTYLQIEGRGKSVLRYHDPSKAGELAMADQSLLPLGLVLSVVSGLARPFEHELLPTADYCLLTPKPAAPKPAERESGDTELRRDVADPGNYVNYFGRMPAQVWLTSSTKTLENEPALRGKAVVVGVQSFEGVDEHQTPLGRMPGATVHALVAASVPVISHHAHPIAFGIDVALGFCFVVLFHLLQKGRDWIVGKCPSAQSVSRLVNILVPLTVLGVTAIAILLLVLPLAVHGTWINPLPMLIGLMVHLYVELVPKADGQAHSHGDSHSPGEAMRGWLEHLGTARRQWRNFGHIDLAGRLDLIVWSAFQAAMLGAVAAAIYILVFKGH